ncbi:MAG: ATP-dependent DNA ligase [Rhodobacteraceae bacterium]|nr:ATP-dependent DNA ligase [Paracoccaceae bacterium]
MRDFAALFEALDTTTSTSAKVAALAAHFRTAPEADRVWTIAILTGRRPRRSVTTTELRRWAAEAAGLPDWLFEDSYAVVGDLAETIALLLPPAETRDAASLADWIARIRGLAGRPEAARRAAVLAWWAALDGTERLVFNKLVTGGFRLGVSQGLLTRALAEATGRDAAEIAHRLMGDWDPATIGYDALILAEDRAASGARPYPFALAHQLDGAPEALGPPGDWRAEWKWDGIRAQVVRRAGALHIWSRGEDLVTPRFPDLAPLADHLPDGTVIDGELVAWGGDSPLPFATLQRRIGRKTVPKTLLREAPARLLAYDLVEDGGEDLRALPFDARRARLATLIAALPPGLPVEVPPLLDFADWPALAALRQTARARGAEGLMLKSAGAPYVAGRRKSGGWWKWKLDPMTIDAVMIYAQAGHGRRANLYTDFTFALRHGDELVPFTKAYSGLTDAEFREISAWVRRNTLERFGPVRRVPPEQVFEIGFEGVQESPRHKSGLALRFPRMLRWRRDKPAAEIDTLETLRALLP